jgi:hypothetical protein
MNQGMTDEKLLPHFHVYVKDRDGSTTFLKIKVLLKNESGI